MSGKLVLKNRSLETRSNPNTFSNLKIVFKIKIQISGPEVIGVGAEENLSEWGCKERADY